MMKKSVKILAVTLATIVLVACASKYNVKVNLTPDEEAAAKTEIQDMGKAINEFIPGATAQIPGLEIIRLAKAYEKLGNLGKAIDIYSSWLNKGYRAKSLSNNLGHLYEQVGETELAVKQYQTIIDQYMDTDYLYDITWAYIKAGDRKNAEKYFNAWQLDKKKTDEQTQQAIKDLRDKEVAAKAK